MSEENVILHLPIKTDEINLSNSESLMIKYNPKITDPVPFSEDLNFQEVNYTNVNESTLNSTKKKRTRARDLLRTN